MHNSSTDPCLDALISRCALLGSLTLPRWPTAVCQQHYVQQLARGAGATDTLPARAALGFLNTVLPPGYTIQRVADGLMMQVTVCLPLPPEAWQ